MLLFATTTGYQIRSFGDAAAKLGVRMIFASDRCDQLEDPWWDQAIPVRFHDEEGSVGAVLSAFGGASPDGILVAGDRPGVLAARVAHAFGIAGNAPDAVAASRNKLATRRAFTAAGLPTPWFEPVSLGADIGAISDVVPYPAVVKPLALSGSQGVMRVNSAGECAQAFARLQRVLQAPEVRSERDKAHDMAVIESFIPGRELAVEGLLDEGTLRVLAVFDKPDPLDGPFFEETIYVTPSRVTEDMRARVTDAVAAAIAALGLRHGPVHAECRVDMSSPLGGRESPCVYVLEAAARPIGGLCSRALRFARREPGDGRHATPADVSLEELLLRHALGEDVAGYVREDAASGVMMIPIPRRGILRGVDGVEEARAVPGVEDVQITAKADAMLTPLPEGRSYLGFIFARAGAPDAVEAALRNAHARLRFTIEREIRTVRTT